MRKGQKGQALILVLIFLLVGGLIIAPLLTYMGTGLKVGQMHEQTMKRFYAADAGIEDALWKLKNYQVPETMPYFLTVNGKDVEVEVILAENVEDFLDGLLDENYSGVHGNWQVTENIVEGRTYTIGVTYKGSMEKEFITGIGAWLGGDYTCTDNSSGDDDITDGFPTDNFTVVDYRGGTAFIWEWQPPVDRPEFGKQSGVYYRSQTFEFSPEEVPKFYISWAVAGPASIGVVTAETFGIYKITSKASDSSGYAHVVAHAVLYGDNVIILAWENNK